MEEYYYEDAAEGENEAEYYFEEGEEQYYVEDEGGE